MVTEQVAHHLLSEDLALGRAGTSEGDIQAIFISGPMIKGSIPISCHSLAPA